MSIDLDAVGRTAGPVSASWDSKDALLYALGVGAGQDDPLSELELTTENSEGIEQQVLPVYAVVVTQKTKGLHVPSGDIDRTKLVHAEQELILHQPLPVEGSAQLSSKVTGIFDKGSGALVSTEIEAVDDAGKPLFTTRSAAFIRGEGGFGGDRGPSSEWAAPDRKPDHSINVTIRPDQALLYRLSGDRNPLHADPKFAAKGGFSKPILHGMCTYGVTARVISRAVGVDGNSFASIYGRFSKPVLPGETLTVNVWSDGKTHLFQTSDSSGDVVLDRGVLTTR
ncbi:acyl dehydratase [Antricoccus suffuscus]|uniref:Acyl dehydratase n=1 Tax=Antricoccus suffuscus TaxID=1629062 RepID=A0A2T1A300_9ACTN|nr:MaoC/PaaZ C-terminal domain-containing protein [Antricoccus suffuscus]PRZ42857.1 acyl dehydratase [Antricoccus suffuscus]